MTPSLITHGNFTSYAGLELDFKIECDGFSDNDWEAFAKMAIKILPAFSHVIGIPKGGLKFARALEKFCSAPPKLGFINVLIVDDVLTSGNSLETARKEFLVDNHRLEHGIFGLVLFSRARSCPGWVTPLFEINWQLSV